MTKVRPEKPSGKARERTPEENARELEERGELAATLIRSGVSRKDPLLKKVYGGSNMAPLPRQRATLVAMLLADARLLLPLLAAEVPTTSERHPVRRDPDTGALTYATVEMVPRIRTARGRVDAREASLAERQAEVARTMVGRAESCGLVFASPEAVSTLAKRLDRIEAFNRDEWLTRETLVACGISRPHADKYVSAAADHESKQSASKTP